MEPDQFNTILQQCIAPVILISGVGLLLSSINTRLGRTIDRLRSLAAEINQASSTSGSKKREELRILFRRGQILRFSIVCLCFSIFCSSTVIFQILILNVTGNFYPIFGLIAAFGSGLGIVFSTIALFLDVTLSLQAIKIEVQEHL
jgi:hypothetical protein